MSTTLSEAERARRQRLVLDGRTASALGISMQALGPLRVATIKTLTTMIHAAMDEHGVDDPIAVLPEILARLQEIAIGEARTAAKVAAREEVQRLLRKAMT